MEYNQLFLEAFPISIAFPKCDLRHIISILDKYRDCTKLERSARTISDLQKIHYEGNISEEDAAAYVINAIFPVYPVPWIIKYITEREMFGFKECVQKILRKIAKKYLNDDDFKKDLDSHSQETIEKPCLDCGHHHKYVIHEQNGLGNNLSDSFLNRLLNDDCFEEVMNIVAQEEEKNVIKVQNKNMKRSFDHNELGPSTSNYNVKRSKEEIHQSSIFPVSEVIEDNKEKIIKWINGAENLPSTIDLTNEETERKMPDVIVIEEETQNRIESNENLILSRKQEKMYRQLMEIFPETAPDFIKTMCYDNPKKSVDELISEILSMDDLPKREIQPIEEIEVDQDKHYDMLIQLFPDADPTYLRSCLDEISSGDELQKFITKTLEKHDYPSYKDYLRKKQLSAQAKQYTTEFNVEKYLELIPNPEKYFNEPNNSDIGLITSNSSSIMLNFLKAQYPNISVYQLKGTLSNTKHLFAACKILDKVTSGFIKKTRKCFFDINEVQNIPLLQLIAYIMHREEIISYIKNKELTEINERDQARKNDSLLTCVCCFDDELMAKEVIICSTGCICCKSCIQRNVEIRFSEGKLDYDCLQNCGVQFSLQDLQSAINPKLFSKIAQRKQLEEVKAAGIDDVELCPFCDFATIPAVQDRIFKCLNENCMKESCRQCKEPSHVPYKCEEIEKDDDVKKRTYIENKMTEALIRKCWKCQMTFIKSDGCNKMTCSCGAMMCYICNKPVTDYKHFNGQGGDRFNLCPLYSDTNKLHRDAVLQSAATAKAEIGVEELKIDPTTDVNEYYKQLQEKHPTNLPPGM